MNGYERLKYVFLLLFFAVFLSSCGKQEYTIITLEDINGAAQNNAWMPVEMHRVSYEKEWHNTYAYDSLTVAEKEWYEDINELLAYRSDESVELSMEGFEAGLTENSVDKIYQCVLIDHPEYFYVDGYEYTKYTLGDRLLGIEVRGSYTLDAQECNRRKAEIEAVVDTVLSQAPLDGTDYDKIKYVYEYIIFHTQYDLEAPDNQNIWSVFVGNASVCQGYAKATQYLLNCMGVDCTLIFGAVDDGEAHSWNMVKADGEYYYLDTTWGDASYTQKGEISEVGEAPEIKYDYLCITTGQLSLTHQIRHDIELPICSATQNNYYMKEGCYFYSYDKEQLNREIKETLLGGQKEVTLKCDSKKVYDEMVGELVTKQRIFEFLGDVHTQVAYIQEEEQLTLTFWVTK